MKMMTSLALAAAALCSAVTGCSRPAEDSVKTTPTSNAAPTATAATAASTAGSVAEYPIGTVIRCGMGGEFRKYAGVGWSKTEAESTWSEGTRSVLHFSLPPSERALTLRMRLAGNVKPPELPVQPVEVHANDKKIADWEVGDSADYTATIPADIAAGGGTITVELRVPKAIAPKKLGANEDPRQLGVCCWELALTEG